MKSPFIKLFLAVGCFFSFQINALAGRLFITDFGSGTVGEYTTSGATVNSSLISGLLSPAGIVVSGSSIYVSNWNGATVGEYTTSGATVNSSLISGLTNPYGLAISGSSIYVGSSGSQQVVGKYTILGETVNSSLISGLMTPYGLAVSGSNIFVSNYLTNTIGLYTTSGTTVNSGFITGLSGPFGIALSGSNIFIADFSSNKIKQYSTSGVLINADFINVTRPTQILISSSRIYVLSELGTVSEYSKSGTLINANLITLPTGHSYYGLAGIFGPSAADTLSSMTPNAYALRGAFIQQSAIINNGLNYDCTTFDVNGICVSAGGRVTDANNPSTNSQGALLIASYRANENWRIGGYLDQNLSSNDPRGVNLDNNNPMGGVFAVWNQNTDGTGYQVRVAAGYSDKDVSISRTAIGTAEAGRGDSSLQSQAYSATLSRGFQLNDSRWIASPYVGIRYTKIKRASYTEETTSDVTTPLSYSRLSQETTTGLAGVRFNGQLAERVNVMASAGVESDIAHNTGDYAASGVDGLTPIAFNQNIRHVRPVAQAGVSYAIDKRQVVSANLMYRQEAFNSSNSTTGQVTYQVGF